MPLAIERPTRDASQRERAIERDALNAAERALREVEENIDGLKLLPPPTDATGLRARAQELARVAFEKDQLTSESPQEALHREYSGWGLPVEEAPGVPREMTASDVLDFLASLLGSGGRLIYVPEAK